jgi:hypothetical protein
MLHQVKDLSPDQRRTVESLLGRPLAEDESISIKGIRPAAILSPGLSPEERVAALENLHKYFEEVDAQRQPVSEQEEENIIVEALRSTRPD